MANVDTELSARSPKRPFSAISNNPRRSTAAQSKSLPPHKRVKIDEVSAESAKNPSPGLTPESTNLPLEKSQESSSDQSATKWFDNVNENVQQTNDDQLKHEEESPFFLARQSTYERPGGLRSVNAESFGLPHRIDTENDDLREVIDDLTVENKRLKLRLKTSHNKVKSPKPNPDKVFEIRMHGLPPNKKRELEQLLKTFTLSLSPTTPSQPSSSIALDAKGHSASTAPRKHGFAQKASAVDSGYASVTTSGLNSTSQFEGNKASEPFSQSNREQEINDYLHDIPPSLLPQPAITGDENARMALVVQRLEHLFTGKSALPGKHSLPVQQQKISRSAAREDRREDIKHNRELKEEGTREAHMLPQDTKINLDAFEQERQYSKGKPRMISDSNSSASGASMPEGSSPEQRPTRPLDLDIHRAQIVDDNIRYLRHLGLSSPEFDDGLQRKAQPWMYLNLLISMAQLHTLNVTPAFVRKAVKKFSTHFEISKDEQKVRWKGTADPGAPCISQESPNPATQRLGEDIGEDTGRRSGRSATSTLNEQASMSLSEDRVGQSNQSKDLTSTSPSTNLRAGSSRDQSKSSNFDYKPIVYKGRRVHLKSSYRDSSSSHGSISPESSGLVHALSRSSLKPKDDYSEGLVTFFNNPYYCADLSGDAAPVNMKPDLFSRFTQVLGVPEKQDGSDDSLRDAAACYFTCAAQHSEDEMDFDCPEFAMPTYPISSAGEDETQPMELAASGIGGVRPEDNFALDVKIERTRQRGPGKVNSAVPERLKCNKQQAQFRYRTRTCSKLELRPSKLPPPSYVFFTSSSGSNSDRGYASDDSRSSSSDSSDSPAPANLRWQWTSSSHENLPDDGAESEVSSSLGDLAGARPRLNSSQEVPGHEGEYVVNQAGRTVSGSLAATVGASWSAASVGDHDENHEAEMELD